MADDRARMTPTKTVSLGQLDAEMGRGGLARDDEAGEIAAPLSQQQLEDAVAAHAAVSRADADVGRTCGRRARHQGTRRCRRRGDSDARKVRDAVAGPN